MLDKKYERKDVSNGKWNWGVQKTKLSSFFIKEKFKFYFGKASKIVLGKTEWIGKIQKNLIKADKRNQLDKIWILKPKNIVGNRKQPTFEANRKAKAREGSKKVKVKRTIKKTQPDLDHSVRRKTKRP